MDSQLDNAAEEFVNEPYTLNLYPHGKGQTLLDNPIKISDMDITLSVFRYIGKDTYMLRLFNGCNETKECSCQVGNSVINLKFTKYEVKTIIYKNGTLYDNNSMLFK